MSQQNSCIENEDGKVVPHSISPVTIENRKAEQRTQSEKQISDKLNNISVEIPFQVKQSERGKTGDQNQGNDIYKQHKQFLQKYKRERQMKLKESKNNKWDLTQEDEEEQIQRNEQLSIFAEVVKSRMEIIHKKIQREFLNINRYDEDRPKYKLFSQLIQTKNDIERIFKQKLFIRSQQSKYIDYSEPQMPLQSKVPQQFRIKSHCFQDQLEMSRKAQQFIQRIHTQQQTLLGKQILRKRKQEFKKKREQRKELQKIQEMNEIKKQERKLKAEQNLLLIKEKQRINQIVSKQSLDELRKMLQDKEKRLQDIRQSLMSKENYKFKDYLSNKGSLQTKRHRIKTSMNDYSSYGLSQNEEKLNQQLRNDIKHNKTFRTKLSLKKRKLSRPAQYEAGQDEFLDQIIQKKDRKSKMRNHTQSINQYPKQLSQKIGESENEKPHSPYHLTEYTEKDAYGMVIPKNQRAKTQNN